MRESNTIATFAFLAILMLSISCNPRTIDSGQIENRNLPTEFIQFKSDFADSLVDHFPEAVNTKILLYNSSKRNSPEHIRYLTLVKEASRNDLESFSAKSSTVDSCLFSVYLRKNVYGFNNHLYKNCNNIMPIPEISLVNESFKGSKISYHIIEANNNTYYNSQGYLRGYLPDEWKNGLSRGVGVIEKDSIIFYWTIVW